MDGIGNFETVPLTASIHRTAAFYLVVSEIIHVPPVITLIIPITGLRILGVAGGQTSACQGITVFRNPSRIIIVLCMISGQIVYPAVSTVGTDPLDIHFFAFRTVIGHFKILYCFFLACFRSFQFVPLVIRQSVSVYILHDPYDTRFGTAVKGVPLNTEIILVTRIRNTVVEADDDITPERT